MLGWGRTDRRVAVAAGPESLLVVHENANAGWQATLGGRRLAATTVDGWEQGFVLPAHAAGTVHLRFAPQRDFLLGLLVGAFGLLLLIVLAAVRSRRRPLPAAVGDGRLPRGAVVTGLVVAGFVLLGPLGVLVTVAGVLIAFVLRLRRRAWLLGPALLVVIGALAAVFPPTSAHSISDREVVQLASWLAVVLAAVTATRSKPDPSSAERPTMPWLPVGRWWPRRSSGRSSPNHDTAATVVADPAVSP